MADTERTLITTDDELDGKRKHMSFNIERAAKYTVLCLFIVVSIAITVIVIWALVAEKSWRDYAIKSLFQNIPGIAALVLVILGLKKS